MLKKIEKKNIIWFILAIDSIKIFVYLLVVIYYSVHKDLKVRYTYLHIIK